MAATTSQANDQKTEVELKAKAVEDAVSNSIPGIAFFAALACGMIVPARGPMVYAMKNNDAGATAKAMGSMSSTAAAIEFLANPINGRLSDKYGRKPFLVGSTAIIAALHSCVAAFPHSFELMFANRAITGACIFTFFNPISASLRDVYASNMEQMGIVGAKLGTMFGMGFAVGPLIGASLSGPRTFIAGALAWASTSLLIAMRYPETLAEGNRKEFDIFASSPLSFLRLLKSIPLAKLVGSVAFDSLAEYPNIYDLNFLFLKTVMDFGQRETGFFATAFGVTQIGAGVLAQQIIASAGLSTYTVLAHAGYVVGFALMGSAKGIKQLALALLVMTVGHNRSGEMENTLADKAKATGMGEGEIQAAQANFLAIIKIVAPLFYGQVFALGNARKAPGLPYFLVAAFVAAAQISFWSVAKEKKAKP